MKIVKVSFSPYQSCTTLVMANAGSHLAYSLSLLQGAFLVSIQSPDELEKLLRAEGEYPSRGGHEDNIMWIYNKLNLPPPLVLS